MQDKRSNLTQEELVGESVAITEVKKQVSHVATTNTSVLILGESGTGKEIVARNIHNLSARAEQNFIPINCGAIPSELLESELFGHEKGAFTGAQKTRKGRFELADRGSVFLDEIGDMPPHMQVKILRVLQERQIERVGGNKFHSIDIRVIAATHRNLSEEIKLGNFREDLYYRLNVFPIYIPPLRERTDDLPLLIEELSTRIEKRGLSQVRFGEDAIIKLKSYDWPGNVRELSNLVERLAILYPREKITAKHLPSQIYSLESLKVRRKSVSDKTVIILDDIPLLNTAIDLKKHLAITECKIITQALNDNKWIITQAAKQLKTRRTTLVEKMKKYKLKGS